jgi:hypothetical protein
MSGITFLSENFVDSANLSLTTGTENSQFPLVNLKNDSPSIKFRSVGSTAVVVIDLLTTRDLDYVALVADPIDSFKISSASIKTSLTNDFTLSTAIPVSLSVAQAIGYVNFTEVTHRFIELTLVGSGGFAEIGKVFAGKGLNIPLNSISISSFKYGYTDNSTVRKNDYGQKFIDKTNQVKNLGGTIEHCTKDEQELIDDMLIRHGKTYPMWMLIDQNEEAMNDGQFKLTIYGYNEAGLEWSADGGQLFTTSIEIKQAI